MFFFPLLGCRSYHEFEPPFLQPGEELVAAGPLVLPSAVLVVLFADVDLAQVEHPGLTQLPRQGLGNRCSTATKNGEQWCKELTANRVS